MTTLPVCVVVGVGPGLGAAYARRFHNARYAVALLARDNDSTSSLAAELGDDAKAYSCDVTDESAIKRTFAKISMDLGAPDVLIYNVGSSVRGTIDSVEPAAFEQAWRINALGLFMVSRVVIPSMKAKRRGTIVITGATASRRAAAATAAFAPAKAAQRSLAEAMAKHLWPLGVHIALIIIDGVIDMPKTRAQMTDKPDSYFVAPNDVAATAVWLTHQPPSAWSFEVEARPFAEQW